MSPGGRVSAAAAVAVVFFCCGPSASAGQTGGASERLILFSGGDFARNAAFAHGGLLWSPRGLELPGFTFRLLLSGGAYRYTSGALGNVDVTGREFVAQFLPGWRFTGKRVELKVFAGLDVQNHRLSPDDPSSRLRGADVGLRVAADYWFEPTLQTMIAANGSVSTIVNSYDARAAYGWKLWDRFYAGPEAQMFASNGYRQWRIGAHVTGFKTQSVEWSLASGFAEDSDRKSGAYFRLGMMTRR
jgi:hypothetical protein